MKEQSERAAETSTFNYHKQRGIKAEIKQYEEQKSEAERYERIMEEKVLMLKAELTIGSSDRHAYVMEIISTRLFN